MTVFRVSDRSERSFWGVMFMMTGPLVLQCIFIFLTLIYCNYRVG